ncbi:hypothetical protein RI367_005249 [Sorochytrium milnesiophthora]
MQTSFYALLGVSVDATPDELRRAYRTKALAAHPDKGGDPEVFRRIQFAYQTLSDKDKRQIYDKYGEQGLELSEKFPILNATVMAAAQRGLASMVFFMLLIIATLVLLCLRVDRFVSFSFVVVFAPLLAALALLGLTLCVLAVSALDEQAADADAQDRPKAGSAVATVLVPFVVLCTFFVLVALASDGTIAPGYIAIPWGIIEVAMLGANIAQLLARRSQESDMPAAVAAVDVFWWQTVRLVQGILLLLKVNGTLSTVSWPVIFIPSYLLPISMFAYTAWALSKRRRDPESTPLGAIVLSIVLSLIGYALLYTTLALVIVKLESSSNLPPLSLCLIPLWIVMGVLLCCFACCLPCMMLGIRSGFDDGQMESLNKYANVVSHRKRITLAVTPITASPSIRPIDQTAPQLRASDSTVITPAVASK